MVTPVGDRTQSAQRSTSERCCALYIQRGTTDITVAEIAAAIGISPRSFYRYFPIKAESVAPVFEETTELFDRTVSTAAPDLPLREVLGDAFRQSLGGTNLARTRALFPLVFADDEMWSVFLRKVHDGESSLARALAPRLNIPADSVPARAAAAAVASSVRIGLETMLSDGSDPESAYLSILDALAAGALPGW